MKRIIVTRDGWLSRYVNVPFHGGIVMMVISEAPKRGWEIEYR